METLSADDLQPFPECSGAPAQIEVNSPNPVKNEDLINDMSTIAQNMDRVDSNQASLDREAGEAQPSLLTIEYYQQYFNVNTYDVLERVINSMMPKRAADNYLRLNIGENPDLYGPFWIPFTLIFSIAISGNIASYLHHASDGYHWHYNFHLVSCAASSIFLYANLLPVVLWVLFKYTLKPVDAVDMDNASYTPTLLSLICIYGYSLAIYIPVPIFCVINISVWQWFLVITAALLSGTALIEVLKPALRNSQYSLFITIGILTAHVVLAAGLLLYFFHKSPDSLALASVTPAASGAMNVVPGNQSLLEQ